MGEYRVILPDLFDKQRGFAKSRAKRKIGRIGRRGGKTTLAADVSVESFLEGRRVLYAVPTADQLDRWWFEVSNALEEPVEAGLFYKNETRHLIELAGTEQRVRGKTAWNSATLRGDYADLLILDEWQHMDEDAWALVGAPMLLDNNGDAIFFYTPPSLHTRSASKARDPRHAAKLFKWAEQQTDGRWKTFHWTSKNNPKISDEALAEVAKDMTSLAYRMEILAEDVTEAPGALWKRDTIESLRVGKPPDLARIVIGVDPSGSSTGAEAGIVASGKTRDEAFVLRDSSLQGSPATWAAVAVDLYHTLGADLMVAEANFGGEMVKLTIETVDPKVRVKLVTASRGKQLRAEPVAALYENKRVHHVGSFPMLEDEMCLWMPGDKSPNRLDALVWTLTELMLAGQEPGTMADPFSSW